MVTKERQNSVKIADEGSLGRHTLVNQHWILGIKRQSLDSGMATCDGLLDAVVKDVEELRDIMVESAIYDYECEDNIINEDEYYSTPATSNKFELGEDFPY